MPSRYHCCREEAVSITYYECGSVTLVIQYKAHAHYYYYVVCDLSGPTVVFHIIS